MVNKTSPNNHKIDGIEYMGEKVKKLLKKCGKDVKIYPLAKIVEPENVEIGDCTQIDDFTFIEGGLGKKIGKHVHIASFVSIIGGGKLEIADFAGISSGSRIITGSDDFLGRSLTNPTIPIKFKPYIYRGFVKIGKHVILGTNTIVHPDVIIGEGAATGSNTLVLDDLEPWSIYVGTPAKKIGDRKKDLLTLEKEFLKSKQ
jgi:galactoside O-acetyltransferase